MSFSSRGVTGAVGLIAALGASVAYAVSGYHPVLPLLLVTGIAAVAIGLGRDRASVEWLAVSKADVIAVTVLLIAVTPLYLWRVYSTPWQVNSDEITIMGMAQRLTAAPHTDLLGISDVFGFPSAVFVFVGRLAQVIGGVSLYHSRLVHGTLGVMCVLVAYAFFRQLVPPVRALLFSLLLGTNHALFAISRMAMRENTSLLLELIALWLLTRGILRRSRSHIFVAGAFAGVAYYAYFPGRLAVFIALAILFAIAAFTGSRSNLKVASLYAAVFVLGWVVAAAPVLIASKKNPESAFSYSRQQFLFYPEGRILEQSWTGEKTQNGAWKANIRNGLKMFNAPEHDQGYIYANYNHAFVDPLSGLLLWAGLLLASVRFVKRRKTVLAGEDGSPIVLGDIVAVLGFLMIYLSTALLITKAPNYTRMLIILPFVSYFTGSAIWFLATRVARRWERPSIVRSQFRGSVAAAAVVVVIALWNINIFHQYTEVGRKNGNDVGSTGRYIEARSNVNPYTWVLAADKAHPYYSWGDDWQWKSWAGIFAGPAQAVEVRPVGGIDSVSPPASFTMFITNDAWQASEASFRATHPYYEVRWITPDSRLLAVEVRVIQK